MTWRKGSGRPKNRRTGTWHRETIAVIAVGSVPGYRRGSLAVHPRLAGLIKENGESQQSFGYVLTHLPTGKCIATCDDPEELLALGEDILDIAPLTTNLAATRHLITPIYWRLRDAGRWPEQDIKRRAE